MNMNNVIQPNINQVLTHYTGLLQIAQRIPAAMQSSNRLLSVKCLVFSVYVNGCEGLTQ